MIKSNKCLRALRKSQKGLTTVEYAIAGGLISAAVIGAFNLLGGSVAGVVGAVTGALTGIIPTI